MTLHNYINNHTNREECQCEKSIDKPDHTIDIFFFKIVAINNPKKEELIDLIKQHEGIHCECDPLDGKEHSYIELGGWIGDQGLALCFMGLCTLLGITNLLTPKILGLNNPELENQMAGAGFITIKSK
jgi:hypothetical protein